MTDREMLERVLMVFNGLASNATHCSACSMGVEIAESWKIKVEKHLNDEADEDDWT